MHSGTVRGSGSQQVHLLSEASVTDENAETLLLGRLVMAMLKPGGTSLVLQTDELAH